MIFQNKHWTLGSLFWEDLTTNLCKRCSDHLILHNVQPVMYSHVLLGRVGRFTECCLSGSLSLMSSTKTLKDIWFLFVKLQDFLLNSWTNSIIMELTIFFQVRTDYGECCHNTVVGFYHCTVWYKPGTLVFMIDFSTSRSHTNCFGERKAGPADWPRRLQAQRYLCICTYRQRKDSRVCYTSNPGEMTCVFMCLWTNKCKWRMWI